jgi:hypothetical protein
MVSAWQVDTIVKKFTPNTIFKKIYNLYINCRRKQHHFSQRFQHWSTLFRDKKLCQILIWLLSFTTLQMLIYEGIGNQSKNLKLIERYNSRNAHILL